MVRTTVEMNSALRERLQHHVEVPAAGIGERHVWQPHALRAAANCIEEALSGVGCEVRRQRYEVEGVACANVEVELLGQQRPAEMVLVGADQRSFWRMGYRALMVTDTASYRNPHYHRPTDAPDKLDFDSMACITSGLARAVAALAH